MTGSFSFCSIVFMTDELMEEIAHQEFMDELVLLEEQIWNARINYPYTPTFVNTKDQWDEVKTYGDEPVFTGLLFDMALKEQDERA